MLGYIAARVAGCGGWNMAIKYFRFAVFVSRCHMPFADCIVQTTRAAGTSRLQLFDASAPSTVCAVLSRRCANVHRYSAHIDTWMRIILLVTSCASDVHAACQTVADSYHGICRCAVTWAIGHRITMVTLCSMQLLYCLHYML